jgi:hypothetical protein
MAEYFLQPIRNPVKYIMEMFKSLSYDPRLAIADSVFGREYNIYAFSTAPLITDPSNYWITWGGYFDNPVGYGFQVFLNFFLTEVFTTAALVSTENCFYIDTVNDILYMNITYKPWQYPAWAKLYDNHESTFTNAPKNAMNPSDIYYGAVKVLPRMKAPSISNKLSSAISGIIVYNNFQIDINNADGKFDDFNITDFFNTPIQVNKTTENAETIEDFNLIRRGFVSDIPITFDKMQVKGSEQTYIMNREFCRKFTADDYPNIPEGNINNDIPVAWGPVLKAPLIEINRDSGDPCTWIEYIALDSEYITSVSYVYDSDGNTLTHTFNSSTGIIRVTEVDGDGEAIEGESATVVGKADNKLGQVIIDALAANENLPYVEGIWDITETNAYLSICADVGFYFGGGTTKELVEAVLKSDNAYLIQKNNGLWTIRQWGQEYDVFQIPSYLFTQKPKKNFKDAYKYFCSTVEILYNLNVNDDNYGMTYVNDSSEKEIYNEYHKSFTAPFKTDLVDIDDITNLAERLIERFGAIRETLQVGLGVDTYQVNLLDTVYILPIVNSRIFSSYSKFIVKENNPGQDILTMEGIDPGYMLTFDGVPAMVDINDYLVVNNVN